MPVDVVESATFADRVQSIADGEPLDATHLMLAAALLASRTRYLFETVLGKTGAGARRLRHAGSLDEVRAIAPTDRNDGDVVLVPRYGLYVFLASATAVDAPPFVLAPALAPGGWFHALHDLAGAARGFATLDATGWVAQPAHGTLLGIYSLRVTGASASAPITTAPGRFVDVGPAGASPWILTGNPATPAAVGDHLIIDAVANYSVSAPSVAALTLSISTTAGAWTELDETLASWVPPAGGGSMRYAASTDYLVTAAGVPTLKLMGSSFSGAQLTVSSPLSMRILHVRP
jgi:hypothetical protein